MLLFDVLFFLLPPLNENRNRAGTLESLILKRGYMSEV